MEARRGFVHRRSVVERAQRGVDARFQQSRNGTAANVRKVARSRPRLRHPLCPDEPFDIRNPQLGGLQRQMCGTRRGEPMRHMDVQCVDITQATLDGGLTLPNDRLDSRRQSRRGRACPPHKPPRIGYRIGNDSQPCRQTPGPGHIARRRRPAQPLPISPARGYFVCPTSASAPVLLPERARPRDSRESMRI